jgi:hypothetical protein
LFVKNNPFNFMEIAEDHWPAQDNPRQSKWAGNATTVAGTTFPADRNAVVWPEMPRKFEEPKQRE